MKRLKWLSPLILLTILALVGCSAQDPAEKWYSSGLIPGSSTSNNTIGDNISPFDAGGFRTLYVTNNTSILDFNGNPLSLGGGGVGPPGPAGPAGPAGDNGTNGQGFTWRGAWVFGDNYTVYDILTDGGSTYECSANITNSVVIPGADVAHFSLVAAKGDTGANGPNNVSANTTTSLSGLLTGVSGNVSSIPLSGNTSLYLNQNGAWTVPTDNDTITAGSLTTLTGVLAGVGGNVTGIDPTGQNGKVLYSDGTNASWQTVPSAGTLTYYFTGTNSTLANGSALITTDKQMTSAPYSPITNVDAGQDANSDAVLQTFATNSGTPNLSYIPAGQFLLHVHAAITAGSRHVTLYGVFREVADNGTNIGTIGTQTESSVILTGVQTEYQLFMSTANTYSMNSTSSRIVVDVHGVFTNNPPNGNTTVRMQVGGTADSHIALPSATVDASNFVPYTGATANVNLGSNNLTAAYYFGNGSNLTGITVADNDTITSSTPTNLSSGLLTSNGSVVGSVTNTLHTQGTDTTLGTTTADIEVGSGFNIDFVTALTSDHTWSGPLVATVTAGENLVIGDAVYLKFSDGKVWKAKGDATTTMPCIGVATATINANATGKILMLGSFRDDTWNWSAGYIYVSHTTAGLLTQSVPTGSGKQVQIAGIALTADSMIVNPQYVIVGLK